MPPTGVALQDARARLFDAADRVVLRDGASALTSRAVTEELGVAKGVLHRHFPDFDTFLAEWVVQKTARLRDLGDELNSVAGTSSVVANLRDALERVFDPLGLARPRTRLGEDAVHQLAGVVRSGAVVGRGVLAEGLCHVAGSVRIGCREALG